MGAPSTWETLCFYRHQKVVPAGGSRGTKRKRFILNQRHGPGMFAAMEGGRIQIAADVAYRGNVTKCAMEDSEHLRPASTLERLAMMLVRKSILVMDYCQNRNPVNFQNKHEQTRHSTAQRPLQF